jgi:hypothetical protein
MTTFVSRQGKPLTEEQWVALRKIPDYYLIHHYKNDWFEAKVEWLGDAEFPYRVETWVDGVQAECDMHATLGKAVNAYQHYLVERNCAEWVEREQGGVYLLEIGNTLEWKPPSDMLSVEVFEQKFAPIEDALASPGSVNYGTW